MNSIRAAALAALALGACNLNNPGFDAPLGELAYPIALALSDQRAGSRADYLYVVNSNFDLRYNGGSVQSYDLNELERALREGECIAAEPDEETPDEETPDAEAEPPLPEDAGTALADGAVADAELDGGAVDGALPDAAPDGEVTDADSPDAEGADATMIDARVTPVQIDAPPEREETLAERPLLCDGKDKDAERVKRCCFFPHLSRANAGKVKDLDPLRKSEVRVDSYATGVAISPDGAHVYVPLRAQSRLLHLDVDEAGQLSCGDEQGRCRRGARYGKKSEIEDLEYPAAPTAVITGSFSDLMVSGRREPYFAATAHEQGQISLFELSRSGAPRFLHSTARPDSLPRVSSLRMDNGFLLVASPAASNIPRIGARADLPANDDRDKPGVYLYRSEPIVVSGLQFSSDIRDVQADDRDPVDGLPSRYYALLRGSSGPIIQSVGFLELERQSEDGRFARAVDAVRVGVGMSKLMQANLGGRQLLFASCFQDGEIHVIDADRRRTVSVIRDVLGPFDMQIDVARSLLYVTDFRASVIRIIDLSGLARGSSGVPRVVATLGAPYTPGNAR